MNATDDQKDLADKLDVNLADQDDQKDDKDDKSDDKQDDKNDQDDQDKDKNNQDADQDKSDAGNQDQDADKDKGKDPDYKKLYGDSTREVQKKYLPMEKEYNSLIGFIDANPDIQEAIEKVLARNAGDKKNDGNDGDDSNGADDTVKKDLDAIKKDTQVLKDKENSRDIEQAEMAIADFNTWLKEKDQPVIVDADWDEFSKTAMVHIKKYAARKLPLKQAFLESLKDEYILQHPEYLEEQGRKKYLLEQKKKDNASVPNTGSSSNPSSKSDATQAQKDFAKNFGVNLDEK